MSDIELVKACAEAMGIALYVASQNAPQHTLRTCNHENYWPLTNDAQAMALVKKFRIEIAWNPVGWAVNTYSELDMPESYASDDDLNRSICECVAKLKDTQ